MGDPTGEGLRLDFERRLLLRFRGFAISSDAGLLAYRALDDVLGLTDTGTETLADARTGKNGRHRLAALLRQSVFGRLAGWKPRASARRSGRAANRVFQDKDRILAQAARWATNARGATLRCLLSYRAQSWNKSRHVVAKVEWHPGELHPRVGCIVTNPARSAEGVVAFYNQRGTCEQYIKEGKGTIKCTPLSRRTFAANVVRLQLHALTYSLGNFMRVLAMLRTAERWSPDRPGREADQDRCERRQPRVLCDVSDGRGRGAPAEVRRNPVADRPAKLTARAGMTSAWVRCDG
jgi:hypothetical protein